MNTNMTQSKDHKVVATQESTAQNSANQSKVFGLFTDQELTNIVNNSGNELVRPSFLINYLHQAEKILDRARMSDENRNFIKGAFAMLCAFGNWDRREEYEFNFQNYDPDDIRVMIEDGDVDGAVDSLKYEMGCICTDINNVDLVFPEEELEEAKEALEGYMSIVNEYDLDLGDDGWTEEQVEKVLILLKN